MTDLIRVPIGTLGEVITGKTPPSSAAGEFGSSIPFITPSDLGPADKFPETERSLSEQGADRLKKILIPSKSVCVVCIGATIGKVGFATSKSCTNQQVNSVVVNVEKYSPEFVYYLFSTLRPWLQNYAGGAATPIVNKSAFSAIEVPIPKSSEEQQKIAAILTAYDDLIENNRQRIALLEKMAEEIYREWFVRLRFPGHEHTPMHKGVPEGWATMKISQTADRHSFGRLYKEADLYSEGKVIVIDQSVKPYLGFHDNEPDHKANLSDPTILFGDHSCKFALMTTPFSVAENVIPFKSDEPSSTLYLFYAAKGQVETTEYKRHWTTLSKKEIFWPLQALRNRFSEAIAPNIKLSRNLEIQNRFLIQTRDLLLNRLISGKHRVDNLDIQFPPSMQNDKASPDYVSNSAVSWTRPL